MLLVELMDGYFKQQPVNSLASDSDLEGGFSEWQRVDSPERLIRDYQFSSRESALEFLRQLLLFEDEINHHGKITVEYDNIRVEVYTHDIDTITELDIEYKDVADQIYFDVS